MLRKGLLVSLLFLLGFSLAASLSAMQAEAASVVGEWYVSGTMTVTVSIPGYGSQTQSSQFYDDFVFYSDGTFEMIDAWGDWRQSKSKFTVYLDEEGLEWYFGEALNADATVTKCKMSGKISGNTISGTLQMNMSLYLYNYEVKAKMTSKSTFIGSRGWGYAPAPEANTQPAKSILGVILDAAAAINK